MSRRAKALCMTSAHATATALAVVIGVHAPHDTLSAFGFGIAALGAATTILWAMEI